MSLSVDVDNQVPTGSQINEAANDAERAVAQQGVNMVQRRLGSVLKRPTGHYRSKVVTQRRADDWAVTDSNVRYGPWLESGRSRRSTRFRGYHTFQMVGQQLQGRAGNIAEDAFEDRLS